MKEKKDTVGQRTLYSFFILEKKINQSEIFLNDCCAQVQCCEEIVVSL